MKRWYDSEWFARIANTLGYVFLGGMAMWFYHATEKHIYQLTPGSARMFIDLMDGGSMRGIILNFSMFIAISLLMAYKFLVLLIDVFARNREEDEEYVPGMERPYVPREEDFGNTDEYLIALNGWRKWYREKAGGA